MIHCFDVATAALSMLLSVHKEKNPVIGQTAAAIAVMAVQSVINAASSTGDTGAALSLIGAITHPHDSARS
jgi:hypothetical protein